MIRLNSNSRNKLYLIMVFVSIILFFWNIWQIKPVIVSVNDPLGLVSHLTPLYWAGLALLLGVSIFAFLDHELKQEIVFLTILIALGLFLAGVGVFTYENAISPNSYYPFSEVYNLLKSGHLDITNSPAMIAYYSWPAYHFISAAIVETTGMGFGFVKYVPLFWIFFFVLITYGIGKRLELPPNRCFLLSFLALSSWLIDFTAYYHPRQIGMILFLVFFMLLLAPRRTVAATVAMILVFAALVLSHGLTAVAGVAGLVLLSLYRRRSDLIVLLFIVIFGVWYIYQAYPAMELGIKEFLGRPMLDILRLSQAERYETAVPAIRAISRYSQLAYLVLYFLLGVISAVLFLTKRVSGERHKQVLSLFFWTVGVALLIFSGYGEASYRVYIFCLIPAVCIIILSIPSRKLFIPVMIVCVAIFLTANYPSQVSWGQVRTTELEGSEFFALEVKPESSYFSNWNGHAALVPHYDPDLIRVGFTYPGWLPVPAKSPSEVDLSLVDRYRYIIISWQGTEQRIFSWGEDPYTAWPQTETGRMADLFYNNGYFQIYVNHLVE